MIKAKVPYVTVESEDGEQVNVPKHTDSAESFSSNTTIGSDPVVVIEAGDKESVIIDKIESDPDSELLES